MAAVYEHGRVSGPQHHDQLSEIPPENEENDKFTLMKSLSYADLLEFWDAEMAPLHFISLSSRIWGSFNILMKRGEMPLNVFGPKG